MTTFYLYAFLPSREHEGNFAFVNHSEDITKLAKLMADEVKRWGSRGVIYSISSGMSRRGRPLSGYQDLLDIAQA